MIKKWLKPVIIASALLGNSAIAGMAMDKSAFQQHVFEYLNKTYPQFAFKKPDGRQDIIMMGDKSFGLFILYEDFKKSGGDLTQFNKSLKKHFDDIMPKSSNKDVDTSSWAKVKDMIRPQLAPVVYLDKADLAHHQLDAHMVATYVIDTKEAYHYVTNDKLKQWNVDMEQLATTAQANLVAASVNLPMRINNEAEKFIIVDVKDGYDAARILAQDFRAFVAGQLGEPFFVAMPNRDYLIMWSGKNSKDFAIKVSENIALEYKQTAYPLSPNTFEATATKLSLIKE